ncbi:uncharacterized protein BDW47DRAFT_31773 [Aspergillus candidus]|uniref:Uncharacterized protein n=1 Tax=Aspergillus candidus TaxID=41067 RepID=A0A2I2FBV3_ASPCN|nr:hypothetical protein BDW47DRAFT_31773 [Aspergillus candidus]PLB38103.1 hypothetical protein BDW47DRAFT_31773 [Aspergillus candidus]
MILPCRVNFFLPFNFFFFFFFSHVFLRNCSRWEEPKRSLLLCNNLGMSSVVFRDELSIKSLRV